MGPHDDSIRTRRLDAQDLSGTWADHVARLHRFLKHHPYVTVTSPRENGTGDFIASWIDPEREGETESVTYTRLGWLMDELEERFGRGPS